MPRGRFIDLTHPLYDGSPSWPGDPGIRVEPHRTFRRNGCRVSKISLGSHQGTHVDAPSHFLKDGTGIDRLPLAAFHGPARLLSIPKEVGGTIDVADFAPYDGLVTAGSRIVVHTGWDAHWGEPDFFRKAPVFSVAAAGFLAARKIAMLGMDLASPAIDEGRAVHEILLGAGVVIVESLANLGECPDEFVISAFPLRLDGLDGSPVRAVAIV
jgi:kynurenine formamidase